MSRIPETELARLRAEVSVARLVEGCGVILRQQGSDLVGACPFHNNTTPSLVITPGKNLWHCMGACARGGGPIDWVMIAQGVSFRHAVELLRESSVSLSVVSFTRTGTGPAAHSTTAKLPPLVAPDAADQELLNTVVGYYAETLTAHDEAQAFAVRRKIDHPEAVEGFRLGFADRTLGYRLPHSQVQAGKEVCSRLQGLGVLRASGHEHFRGSLVIPVLDAEGNSVRPLIWHEPRAARTGIKNSPGPSVGLPIDLPHDYRPAVPRIRPGSRRRLHLRRPHP